MPLYFSIWIEWEHNWFVFVYKQAYVPMGVGNEWPLTMQKKRVMWCIMLLTYGAFTLNYNLNSNKAHTLPLQNAHTLLALFLKKYHLNNYIPLAPNLKMVQPLPQNMLEYDAWEVQSYTNNAISGWVTRKTKRWNDSDLPAVKLYSKELKRKKTYGEKICLDI